MARGQSLSCVVNEKMRVLSDFGICDKYDETMKKRLFQTIQDSPDKDPREVLDAYCRPMIQKEVNSWK